MSENVASAGLTSPWVCTQCGVCGAICPVGAVETSQGLHGYAYARVDKSRCVQCGKCAWVCPGPRATPEGGYVPPSQRGKLYGPVQQCILAWARDTELRRAAASGGLVTGLLVSLLHIQDMAGAVVTALGGTGCLPRTFVARTPGDVAAACGSIYMITSMRTALTEVLAARDDPFAVVGLPCQISGIRRATQADAVLRSKIRLLIGLFCGGTKDYRYREALARMMGLDAERLTRFSFRGGGWPGFVSGADAHGTDGRLPVDHPLIGPIWATAQFTPPRCLLCDDGLAAAADLAVGDPWHLRHVGDEDGKTLVLVRTPAGQSALEKAARANDVVIGPQVSFSDVCASQEGILWRRFYAPSRIRLAALWARGWRETARELPVQDPKTRLRAAYGVLRHLGRMVMGHQ